MTDGPFAETREQLGGHSVVDAKDLDEAIAIAGRITRARWGTVEVRPLIEIPGLPTGKQQTLLQVNCYQFDNCNSLMQCLLLEDPHELEHHKSMLRAALLLKESTTPQARVAVIWAGILPYFSERPCVDLLGKNDRTIAYGPNEPFDPPPLPFFASAPVPYCWPGHTKRDYRYSVRTMDPDVIQPWNGIQEIDDIVRQKYNVTRIGDAQFLVKRDSAEVNYKKLSAQL